MKKSQISLLKIPKTLLESNQIIYYKTPIGTAKINGDELGIQSISVKEETLESSKKIPNYVNECVLQLGEYFNGTPKEFDLKLNPLETIFQKKKYGMSYYKFLTESRELIFNKQNK